VDASVVWLLGKVPHSAVLGMNVETQKVLQVLRGVFLCVTDSSVNPRPFSTHWVFVFSVCSARHAKLNDESLRDGRNEDASWLLQ
jgi:hypothetical protein